MKYRPSFYKHNCTSDIANYVVATGIWYEIHISPSGNDQVVYVGWDKEGATLWEIAIELYPDGEEDWAFHAKKASAHSRQQVRL